VPEVVRRPALGWLVTAGHDEAFFRAMQAALSAPDEARRRMGRQARAEIAAHFDERTCYLALARHIQDTWGSRSVLRRRLLCRTARGRSLPRNVDAPNSPPNGRPAPAGD